jgi:hypothetical protein
VVYVIYRFKLTQLLRRSVVSSLVTSWYSQLSLCRQHIFYRLSKVSPLSPSRRSFVLYCRICFGIFLLALYPNGMCSCLRVKIFYLVQSACSAFNML